MDFNLFWLIWRDTNFEIYQLSQMILFYFNIVRVTSYFLSINQFMINACNFMSDH